MRAPPFRHARYECSRYRGLHVNRESVGVEHRATASQPLCVAQVVWECMLRGKNIKEGHTLTAEVEGGGTWQQCTSSPPPT